jgi:hypothetical protein
MAESFSPKVSPQSGQTYVSPITVILFLQRDFLDYGCFASVTYVVVAFLCEFLMVANHHACWAIPDALRIAEKD